MRSLLPVLGAVLCAGATALAQVTVTPTALEAIKLLPKDALKRVARIEAREGKPEPDRWHILVYNPAEETGVHEYVIAGDEIVASRNVSQFVEKLTETDVLGEEAIKIDSNQASKLTQQYALANNATVAAMNYELLREGDGAAPLWKVSCVDEAGKTVGSLVLTASKGTVVSHDGFPIEPVASQEKLAVEADTVVGDAPAAEMAAGNVPATPPANATASNGVTAEKSKATATPKKKTATKSRSKQSDGDDRARDDDDDGRERPRFFRRAGGKLQKFFTGRDTISR